MKTAAHEADPVEIPEIWNPNAAACWSILFTPAFGSYLHARNWKSLGDTRRAAANARWMLASVTLDCLKIVLAAMPDSRLAAGDIDLITAFQLLLLLAWYYSEGKAQIEFVRKNYGEGYSRRRWAKPMWVSIIAYVIVVATIVVVKAAVLPPSTEEAAQQAKILMVDQFAKSPDTKNVQVEKLTLIHNTGNLYVGTVELTTGSQRSTHSVEVLYDKRNVQFEIKP